MKILLSAFACAPNTGSEPGVGWRYALHLSKSHEVHVLTDITRRELIDPDPDSRSRNLFFHYYRPSWLLKLPLNSKTAQLLHQFWQLGAWRYVRELDKQQNYDFCWHLTYGVFRQPSWMWKVGKPFVFGPVGGGESAPMRLWKGMAFGEKVHELMREVINRVAWWLPGLHDTYRHADLVIAKTQDTLSILPDYVKDKAAVQLEVGGYAARIRPEDRKPHDGHLRILFAGRLLGLKGLQIAIPAFASFLNLGGHGVFTIVGDGPMAHILREQVEDLGLQTTVRFAGKLSQGELFKLYEENDLLLFPSLHDSSGNVVIEALSFGMPVVCLDLGGPKEMVNSSCGMVVPVREKGVEQVAQALADALLRLHADPEYHLALCHGALTRAGELTWEKQIERVMALIGSHVFRKSEVEA